MSQKQIGLIGLGTVGGGVARLLVAEDAPWRKRLGDIMRLHTVADTAIDRIEDAGVLPPDVRKSRDAADVIGDPEIDVVIELVGGLSPAREFVLEALGAGKDVVTANKALLAAHGHELYAAARRHGRCLAFEAAVCGGIPIVGALRSGLVANRICSLHGIVNGTCNYILTQMTERGVGYSDALGAAQERGYAEADPTLDVEGHDSVHKLAVLARLAYGAHLDSRSIYCEGVAGLEYQDIEYAGRLGYVLKLLAIARSHDDAVELRVHPTLLRRGHPLAAVSGVFNAVLCQGDVVGQTMFYGKGAGREATASAVVADLVDVALGRYALSFAQLRQFDVDVPAMNVLPMDEVTLRYYLRVSALDRPGVLARVSGALGRHQVSISSVIQHEVEHGSFVPLVLMTHLAREGDVQAAIEEINSLDCIQGEETRLIRVEDI